MRIRGAIIVIFAFPLAVSRPRDCPAEDTVTVLSGKDAKTRTVRKGEVVEFTGESLQLKSSSGRVESIPAARVVDVKTEWTPAQQQGDALRAKGKQEAAINSYKQAKRDEPRAWARRRASLPSRRGSACPSWSTGSNPSPRKTRRSRTTRW